ncbi:DUF3793 family protein [Lachnospiraceae bacterium OttesenSCG-928-J05]|nr:DUF3793 family protein [Lachnospiraceae bacterium OttesenSCG-928-J05]
MSSKSICAMLATGSESQKVAAKVILQCAPFLKGIKVSCILNIEAGSCCELREVLANTDIKTKCLASRKGKCLVFLYRQESFRNHMKRADICKFLKGFGYREFGEREVLAHLQSRVEAFSDENIGFPHEIGIFLDYPLEDVKGYIENLGQNSLYTGYWKVYHDLEKAKATFTSYQEAREEAVKEYLLGRGVVDIARQAQ